MFVSSSLCLLDTAPCLLHSCNSPQRRLWEILNSIFFQSQHCWTTKGTSHNQRPRKPPSREQGDSVLKVTPSFFLRPLPDNEGGSSPPSPFPQSFGFILWVLCPTGTLASRVKVRQLPTMTRCHRHMVTPVSRHRDTHRGSARVTGTGLGSAGPSSLGSSSEARVLP